MHPGLKKFTKGRARVALLALAAGCGRAETGLDNAADSLAVRATIAVDTVHVDGRNPPLLNLIRDLEIGSAADTTAPDWIAGTRVLTVAPDGRVAVNTRRRLKVFAATGAIDWFTIPDEYRPGQMRNAMSLAFKPKDGSVPRPNRWFNYVLGSAAGAPGQLSDAHSIVFAGDTIAVMDLATGLQLFNRAGRSLAISPVVPPRDSNRYGAARLTTIGPTAAGWIGVFRTLSYQGDDLASGREQLQLYRLSTRTGALGNRLAFRWRDSAAQVTVPYSDPRGARGQGEYASSRGGSGSRTTVLRDPFAPQPQHVVANGSLYFASGRDLVIDVYDGYGRHTRTIDVSTERRPLTDSLREARIKAVARQAAPDTTAADAKGATDSAFKVLGSFPVPRYRNVVAAMFVAANGAIAVQRLDLDPPLGSPPNDKVFDLLHPDGTARGRVTIPPELGIMHFTGDAFYCVEQIGELPPTGRSGEPRRSGQNARSVPVQRIVRLTIAAASGK